MNDKMNELTQFSSHAGELFLEKVPGEASRQIEHENNVKAEDGADRSMYAYAPKSGCPDPKQNQVLMVLRDGNDEASAAEVMKSLGLDRLAEEEHFLLLFPNPTQEGWNYQEHENRENDVDFLIRCFGILRSSQIGVGGFNGMIYYVAVGESASALMMNMAARKPQNVSAMMLGEFPSDYRIPQDALHVETAVAIYKNAEAEEYFREANGEKNPNVRLLSLSKALDEEVMREVWDRLFSKSRRWQNDTYGTYQRRTDFTLRGFIPHVKDTSLGCNDGFAHTWYEYIPPQLRNTKEKVPLVFYFHGVNCVPLYGAEQSNLHDIADRENFIVVYPAPAICKAWNIYNDPHLPSDFAFVMSLIEHMKQVHPIDETRIYISGFSMGGMMTHALAAVYPDIFAAAAPCNAFDFAYFKSPRSTYGAVVKGVKAETLSETSTQKIMADEKWKSCAYRMPIFQNAGCIDDTIGLWPIDETTDDVRMKTIARWKHLNNIPAETVYDRDTLSGLAADENFYEDSEERYYHQRWHSSDPGEPVLLELVTAKRMPHAICPVQMEYAWEFLKKFRRLPDGSLEIQ